MSKASDLLEIIEWGLETHKEKLMFGLPDLLAAIVRETRLNSILVDCKEGIQSIEAENGKLKAELEGKIKAMQAEINRLAKVSKSSLAALETLLELGFNEQYVRSEIELIEKELNQRGEDE